MPLPTTAIRRRVTKLTALRARSAREWAVVRRVGGCNRPLVPEPPTRGTCPTSCPRWSVGYSSRRPTYLMQEVRGELVPQLRPAQHGVPAVGNPNQADRATGRLQPVGEGGGQPGIGQPVGGAVHQQHLSLQQLLDRLARRQPWGQPDHGTHL